MLIQMYAGGRPVNGTAPEFSGQEYSDAVGSNAGVLLPEVNWLEADWRQGTLVDLVDHVVFRHHAYTRRTLPRLASLMNEVLYRHGDLHPEILELATTFLDFSSELLAHMNMEEALLHTRIRELEAAIKIMDVAAPSHQNRQPEQLSRHALCELVSCMEDDHQVVDGALEHMRQLTHNFTPPPGASTIYRALLALLAELEEDMRRHVYEENEVLFPRAIALEDSLRSTCRQQSTGTR